MISKTVRAQIQQFIKLPPYDHFLFFLLVVFGIAIRVIKLITNLNFFGGDFAFYYFLTRTIVIDHTFPLVGRVVGDIGGFTQGAGWYYLLALPFAFTGGDPYGAKVLMFVVSIAILIIGSMFSWIFIGKKEAIFICFFLTISQYLILYTDRPWPPYIIPLLTIFYLMFLFLFLIKKKKQYLFLMTLSLGLMSHFEIASLGILLISFIIFLFYCIKTHLLKKIDLLSVLTIFAFVFIPHFFYDIFHEFYNLQGILNMMNLGKGNFFFTNFSSVFANRLHLFKLDITSVFPSINFSLLILFLIFLVIGSYLFIVDRKIEKERKIFLSYILLTFITSFFGLLFFPAIQVPFWWITFLTIFYTFLAGLIMSYLWNLDKLYIRLIIVLITMIFTYSSLQQANTLVHTYHQLEHVPYTIDTQEPIEYIYSDSNNKDYKILYITDETDVLQYKYLFWYIGKTKYKNSQIFKNLNLQFSVNNVAPLQIDVPAQFKKLGKGSYYLIITKKSVYTAKLMKKFDFGKLISKKDIGSEHIVEKRIIE